MTQLYIALVIALAGFFGGWQVNGWRYEAKEKDRVEQQAELQRMAAREANRRQDNVIAAQNAAAARMAALRGDADAARSELERLRARLGLDPAGHAPPEAAGTDPAVARAELLGECAARYTEVARACDGHVNDLRTLMQSWPR